MESVKQFLYTSWNLCITDTLTSDFYQIFGLISTYNRKINVIMLRNTREKRHRQKNLVSREWTAQVRSIRFTYQFLGLNLASCNSRTKLRVTQAPRGNVLCQTLLKVCNKEEKREQRTLGKTLCITAWRVDLRVRWAAGKWMEMRFPIIHYWAHIANPLGTLSFCPLKINSQTYEP